jgi:UDP-glucose 4-epimerase
VALSKSYERVLVTGGAGFIGSHLTEALVNAGQEVVVLDDLSEGRKENLSKIAGKKRLTFAQGDIRNVSALEGALEGVGKVVHLAALKSVAMSVSNPALVLEVNAEGTRRSAEASLKYGVSKFVYASSCAVYGEAKYLPIDEGHPLQPLSPYAESKQLGEKYCTDLAKRGVETTVLRFFNIYGPRQDSGPYGGVVAKFGQQLKSGGNVTIYGSGEQTRDFLSVHDAVNAILLSLAHPTMGLSILNIGSGEATSMNELANTMASIVGTNAKPIYADSRAGELLRSQADIGRAKNVLGFKPKVKLKDGLREFLD